MNNKAMPDETGYDFPQEPTKDDFVQLISINCWGEVTAATQEGRDAWKAVGDYLEPFAPHGPRPVSEFDRAEWQRLLRIAWEKSPTMRDKEDGTPWTWDDIYDVQEQEGLRWTVFGMYKGDELMDFEEYKVLRAASEARRAAKQAS